MGLHKLMGSNVLHRLYIFVNISDCTCNCNINSTTQCESDDYQTKICTHQQHQERCEAKSCTCECWRGKGRCTGNDLNLL